MSDRTEEQIVEKVALLRCPFCGGEAQSAMIAGGGIEWAQVECVETDCGAVGPAKPVEAEAIAAWNTRADLSHDKLREALIEARISVAEALDEAECGENDRLSLDIPVLAERIARKAAALNASPAGKSEGDTK